MFPWYLSIGMTYDQFWTGPPSLAVAYRKAEEFRAKRENDCEWRQGLYMVRALSATVGNMFLKQGATPIEYPDRPFPLTQEEVEAREIEKQEMMEAKLKASMMRWAAESQAKKEGGTDGE